ncbi:hypothetical protein HF313_14960 [Massilia atriviolacea]|uniref:Uncharacterized protein n=1 Tax=Massilia atriviolacea TaxID=2495579 RepID=A0A430HR65_9BURK|nr:hypothetical protein [Massilia atriviolacea]RSZ60012.1 hypothetical protein EJB06_07485 [Massilia atriviolacea]
MSLDQIFDALGRADSAMQKQVRINELTNDISKIGRRCGDCDKWMKSSGCPAERNVKGRNVGPSCESIICKSFAEAGSATRRRADLTERLQGEQAS